MKGEGCFTPCPVVNQLELAVCALGNIFLLLVNNQDYIWLTSHAIEISLVVLQWLVLFKIFRSFREKYMENSLMQNQSSVNGKKLISRPDLAKAKILFDAIPKQGDLDLELVKQSIYFFS